mgnify:CR=1 FL=1
MTKYMIPIALGLAVPIGLAYLGLTKTLGAHIWWDVKTIVIGAPFGVALAFLPLPRALRLFGCLAIALLAFGAAKYGQTQFAASYAEDALAGKLWYFGWILCGVGFAALISTVSQRESNVQTICARSCRAEC